MTLLETLAIKLSASIAKALIKSLFKGKLTPDVLNDMVGIAAERGTAALEQRKESQRIDEVAKQVVASMRPVFEVEAAALPIASRDTVVREVAMTLTKAQISADLLVAVNLEPQQLAQHLAAARSDATHILGAAETALYRRMLQETSRAIIGIATQLSGFEGSAYAATLQGQDQIFAMLKELTAQPNAAAASFEADYRAALVGPLDRMELFGLPRLDRLTRNQSLSIAYVTLQVERRVAEQQGSDEDLLHRLLQASVYGQRDETATEHRTSPVDQLLAVSRRIVVRGEPGSGKSTLLQWLAVRSARGDFPAQLTNWNNSVPFFIRLRERVGKDFPTPDEFPQLVARSVAGAMPQGWVHGQLRTGRALVLIDGVDELPRNQRDDMLGQLGELVAAYPLARYVVTSRPPALKAEQWPEWTQWVKRERFAEAALLPMGVTQIESFITNWHAALAATLTDDGERAELAQLPANLRRLLRQRIALRRLATTPLLCAMICALHRERLQQLPSERIRLYQECCEMLLDRRDEGRRIALDPDYPALSYPQKLALVQGFAYWLMRNGYSDVEIDEVDDYFSDKLPTMSLPPEVSGTGTRRYFAERSGLLREPVKGRIDFAHRTFQEFLAAQQALKDGDIGVLIDKALNDQWRETIILAAGEARPREAERLLKGLIAKSNKLKSERNQQQLQLLAVACLETCVELAPEVRRFVLEQAAGLFPPTTTNEAKLIAAVGEMAVPLLVANPQHGEREAAASIQALAQIGTDRALAAIADYAGDTRTSVVAELGRAWDAFERLAYAQQVLAQMPQLYLPRLSSTEYFEHLKQLTLLNADDVSQISSLQGLSQLRNLTTLRLGNTEEGGLEPKVDVSELITLPKLTQLSLTFCEPLRDLAQFTVLTRLRSLDLWPCNAVTDLRPLIALNKLTSLRLWSCLQLQELSPLAALPALSTLSLSSCLLLHNLRPLGMLILLQELSLVACRSLTDLSPLSRLTRLTKLDLSQCSQLSDLSPLASLSSLQRLDIRGTKVRDLTPLAGIKDLRIVRDG